MPVIEDDGFTFLYNSKDLCLLPVMDKVMSLGLQGLKIEGRNRTSLYIATSVQVYRQARDAYIHDPENFTVRREWEEEISRISNREYFTGFFLDKPRDEGIKYDFSQYIHTHHLAARVVGFHGEKVVFEARNPLIVGMDLEWMSSDGRRISFKLSSAKIGRAHV